MNITTQVRGGERTLNEFGRLLKFVSGTPGTPSGDVKWSTSWPICGTTWLILKHSSLIQFWWHQLQEGKKYFSSIYPTTYSSMSTKDKSIRIQCYSVFPGQIASNFVPAYQLQSGDESKHARQQGERGISKGKACNVSLTHHKFSWDENWKQKPNLHVRIQ